ncbi:MAG: hypothetical protein QM779_16655 [Propionicimonas sp.]|uniref:DNA-3-methyladenine glycosylase family protein n=1 Tax=Propionicimonas sp. TaxID=1955623 RepID=UPI003D0C46DC
MTEVEIQLPTRGPFSLRELALFGFGHRAESDFDGVMRLAFCLDDDFATPVAAAVTQSGEELSVRFQGVDDDAGVEAAAAQVARVLSVDHDGLAFLEVGRRDPVIGRLQAVAPGLRPPLFYSPYEAAVWSVLSFRRPRAQGIRLREALNAAHGTTFDVAGRATSALPTPTALLEVDRLPGLPADRIPRLHAVAQAALEGRLSVPHLTALTPEEAMAEVQELPGIGPFYSALIVIRACGLADVLALGEPRARELVGELYGIAGPLDDRRYAELAEQWRPFRTWATVLIRAAAGRLP